jgi:hypothetical protein
MKNLLNQEIPEDIRGLLYLCEYSYKLKELKPFACRMYSDPGDALTAYCETPNPPSQVAMGNTREEFEKELNELHANMVDKVWLKELGECL